MRILAVESLRFPGEGSSAQGKSGPKARPKGVADGQQAEIPVLRDDRTVGTHAQAMSREWKARRKERRAQGGKTPCRAQCSDAERNKSSEAWGVGAKKSRYRS